MKKFIVLILALVSIVACKNDTKTENQSVPKVDNPVSELSEDPNLKPGCYEYNSNGNHIKMEISEVNENVTGNLNIAYAEKDANQGQFVGNLNGNKLIGIYTFNSEGKESSRQVAFLVKDNQLIEGFGVLNEGGTKFNDVNSIKYTSTTPLTSVDCDK